MSNWTHLRVWGKIVYPSCRSRSLSPFLSVSFQTLLIIEFSSVPRIKSSIHQKIYHFESGNWKEKSNAMNEKNLNANKSQSFSCRFDSISGRRAHASRCARSMRTANEKKKKKNKRRKNEIRKLYVDGITTIRYGSINENRSNKALLFWRLALYTIAFIEPVGNRKRGRDTDHEMRNEGAAAVRAQCRSSLCVYQQQPLYTLNTVGQ